VHQYRCPVCRASDRCRLYALYVNRYLKQNPRKTIRFLDIAPSRSLSKFLKSQPTFQIRTADLFAQGVDDVVDICDMKIYQNDSFDALLCSHVLEHVTDDRRAMSELFRVLRPGGWAILMVPINLAVAEIDEDCNVTDPGERWRRFGQDDHVRRYSKAGFVNRLEDAGFRVEQLGVSYFGRRTFSRYGLSPTSVLYIGHKA
jgi:SAM-dependent methyltransferase